MKKSGLIVLAIILVSSTVLAHGVIEEKTSNIESLLFSLSIPSVLIAFGILLVTSLAIVFIFRNPTPLGKKFTFIFMLLVIVIPTIFIFSSLMYVSLTSYSGGKIHWHADFEIFVDGELLELKDPEGFLSNKVGSPRFHEHDDNRIHAEGIFQKKEGLTLRAFLDEVDGVLEIDKLVFPTVNGVVEVKNSDTKTLKAVVKKGVQDERHWEILEDFPNHVISPYAYVPPGDFIILVYDGQSKEQLLQDVMEDDKYGSNS